MAYTYDRYLSHMSKQPWAILPDKFQVLAELMRFRASGGRMTDADIEARVAAAADGERTSPPRVDGSIAVIPILGVIGHRMDSFEMSSGGTSTQAVSRMLRRAVNDETIGAVILDISSPGGTVEGVPELAAEIFAARKAKPVIAHANALSASAAYWLGSQASEFYVTPSGMTGSIGVYMLTTDYSEYLSKEGIKINPISAGDNKLEGNFWEPMSDETRAHLQGQVDAVYAEFVAAVSKGRGVSAATVKKEFGQGRMYDAKESLDRKMVDGILTFDQLIAKMAPVRRSGGARADAVVPTIAAEALVDDEHNDAAAVDAVATAQAQADADALAIAMEMVE